MDGAPVRAIRLGMEYLTRLPDAVPPGKILVHDADDPVARPPGTQGSRMWLDDPDPAKYQACDCGWAVELGAHYRMIGS